MKMGGGRETVCSNRCSHGSGEHRQAVQESSARRASSISVRDHIVQRPLSYSRGSRGHCVVTWAQQGAMRGFGWGEKGEPHLQLMLASAPAVSQ